MTREQHNKPAEGVSTALAILDTLVTRAERAWGVRELAEHLNMMRTTVNRFLSQLTTDGLATKTADSSYTVGPRLAVLSSALHRLHPALNEGRKVLDSIRRHTGGTVFMSVQAADGRTCFVVLESESETPIRYRITPGDILPTYAGAAGLAILSQLGEEIWPDEVPLFTKQTLVSRQARSDCLHRVKSQGFAVSVGQHIEGAAGIAIPFCFSPTLKGSVSVSRPSWEFKEGRVTEIVTTLREKIGKLQEIIVDTHDLATHETLPTKLEVKRASTQVERVNQLLTYLASHPSHPLALTDVCRIVGAGRFAVTSLVEAAEQHGILSRNNDGALYIGPTLLRWSAVVGPDHSPVDLALSEMRRLSNMTGETICLALLEKDSSRLRMVQSVPGEGRIQYVLDPAVDVPLHLGAAGKAVLAFAPEWLNEIDLVPDAQGRIVEIDELRTRLADIRAKGYVTAEGERIPQAYGVAAPIFIDGKIAGSINVTTPRYRVDRSRIEIVADQVKQAAHNLSQLFSIT